MYHVLQLAAISEELSLRDMYGEFLLFCESEGTPLLCAWISSSFVGTHLFAFLGGVALDARLAIEHGPCEASHLRRDRGVQRSSPVVYGSIEQVVCHLDAIV